MRRGMPSSRRTSPVSRMGVQPDEVGDGVVEAVRSDGVPCSEEDDVAHEDFVFECGSEMALGFA